MKYLLLMLLAGCESSFIRYRCGNMDTKVYISQCPNCFAEERNSFSCPPNSHLIGIRLTNKNQDLNEFEAACECDHE